ncbi:MAG: hypothetical protein J6Y71_02460 [Ruminococcus sp.]|nr:hypothetical protein [Ruminococcus sp.]
MKKEFGFEIIENTDDKNIDRLSEHSTLTEKEKERMLKMSMEKLSSKMSDSESEIMVSGVEHYKRPKWYSFAAVAACFVLVAGAVGTAIFLGTRGGRSEIDPLTTTESTTVPATTDIPETENNEELVAVAEKLFAEYYAYIDIQEAHLAVDDETVITVDSEYGPLEYTLVKNYNSVDEIRAYYREFFTENLMKDSWINDDDYLDRTLMFHEENGRLYYHCSHDENVLGDGLHDGIRITSTDENRFTFMRLSEYYTYCYNVSCVKEDGKWKIDSIDEFDEECYEENRELIEELIKKEELRIDDYLEDVPDGADLSAVYLTEDWGIAFYKPVDELSDGTLLAAAQPLLGFAGQLYYNMENGGIYPFQGFVDIDIRIPEGTDGGNTISDSGTEDDQPVYCLIKDVSTRKEAISKYYYMLFSDKYPYPEKLESLVKEYEGRFYAKCDWVEKEYNGYVNPEIISYDGRVGDEFFFTVRDHYYDSYDAMDEGRDEMYHEDREFTTVMDDDGVWHIGKYTYPLKSN